MPDAAAGLFCPSALLPGGWARDVALYVDARGDLARVETDAAGAARTLPRAAGPVVPGLPDVHSHAFQRGFAGRTYRRGPAGDSFWTWREAMYDYVAGVTPEEVERVARRLYADLLEHGFTAVGEFHYLHHAPDGTPYDDPAELARRIEAAAAATGIGLTLLPVFYAHGGFGGAAPGAGQRRFVHDLDGFARLVDALAGRDTPQRRLGLAPHSLRATTPDELDALLALRRDRMPGAPVHLHVAEQTGEVEACLAWSGRRPVAWLLDHAPVDAAWCLVHATHMTGAETRALAASGAVAGLCPTTEADLGDGLFPAPAYLAAGGRFGVGTDSHVRIDAAEELRLLEYGQRLARRERNVLRVAEGASGHVGADLYRAACAGGARALGRPVGALAAGRRADLVVLRGDDPLLEGLEGDAVLDAYVFAGGRALVRDVYVGGRHLVQDGRHVARRGDAPRGRDDRRAGGGGGA